MNLQILDLDLVTEYFNNSWIFLQFPYILSRVRIFLDFYPTIDIYTSFSL